MKKKLTIALMWLSIATAAIAQHTDIAPLLTSRWGQWNPYNLQGPVIGGKHCPTGCVATAMAQAMRHFEWPEDQFAWSKMKDTYAANTPASSESAQAVAQLMAACGKAANMQYSSGSAAAWEGDAAVALHEQFGYAGSVHEVYRSMYGRTAWENIIYHELEKGRPVIYGGMPSGFAHQFVCDGYRQSDATFHFNMAWEFKPDGYYSVDELDIYNDGQTAIVGICPTGTSADHGGEEFLWGCLRCKVTGQGEVWVRSIEDDAAVGELIIPSAVEWEGHTWKVTGIAYGAFEGCTALTRLVIPASVEVLGRRLVYGCEQLTEISVAEDNLWYWTEDGVLRAATELLAYPMTKTSRTYRIPANIDYVPANLFRGNVWLERVEIPAAVKGIDILAFRGCTGLRTVVSESLAPSAIEKQAFDADTYANATLIVPAGSAEKYRSQEGWKQFAHIEEGTTGITPPTAAAASRPTRYRLDGTVARNDYGITLDPVTRKKLYKQKRNSL